VRISLLVLFIFFACCSCAGQARFGIKAGFQVSDIVITNYINPDVESEYDLKLGVHAALFADFDIDTKLQFTSELMYTNRGVNAISRINLHYINVPLLAGYKLTPLFTLHAGPDIGYLFMARSSYGDVSNTWNNKLDIGLDAGVVCNLSARVMLTARYYAGFSSVMGTTGDPNNPQQEPVKYQNRVLQFSLSWILANNL
jgi:hypothetical protein